MTYKEPTPPGDGKLPYDLEERTRGAQVIGGTIFNTRADLTHPLLYGVENTDMPVFRRGDLFMNVSKGKYADPLIYTSNPLLAGYISEEKEADLAGTAAITVSALGGGRIVTFADNPNFRAFWFGTNRLFLNSVFFGHAISGSSTR